jgi:signal transduction histidine kinase
VSFFIVLIGLYFTSRFFAGKSIAPVQEVSHTISRITKHNLRERVALPNTSDEIHELASNFNSLLDRIEDALERERQFTSDASHELRTPLAVLRGTLEVLIRKPRTREEYEDKIRYVLEGISRMAETLEQLLLMARLDSGREGNEIKETQLTAIIDNSLVQLNSEIKEKGLKIKFSFDEKSELSVPSFYSSLIVDNLVSNAVKYSLSGGIIRIHTERIASGILFKIEDYGIGIQEGDLTKIFDNFYRSNALNHKQIPGNGLGLSIVKKCVEAIGAEINIESKAGEGTRVTVIF